MNQQFRTLPRQVTAMGTVGSMGQLFTVLEKNWVCSDCSQENYASMSKCFRCKRKKPIGLQNFVENPALAALQNGEVIKWQEVIDPTTFQVYYYNKETGLTQWERPVEMGPAPHATGWFGRGMAGSTAAQMFAAKNEKYLTRPARKQKDFIDPKKYHLEGAQEYNIWYGKFIGDLWDQGLGKEAAVDRCNLERDAGHTRADGILPGTDKKPVDNAVVKKKDRRFFCLHFARGMCAKGHECIFFHRIPTPQDDASCDELFDCFGRQRHNKHRDDMNGVGSFMKPCRTLFVGNLLKSKYDTPKALEDAVWKHFSEWGELENCNVIHRLSIAFPRYRLRTSAEFAKEAMTNQTLDHSEILSIRWAFDDPNPVALDAIKRADADAVYAMLQSKGVNLKPANFEHPMSYSVPDAKRLRLEDGTDISQEYPSLAYPDTDSQYTSEDHTNASSAIGSYMASGSSSNSSDQQSPQMTPEEYAAYCTQYYANYYAQLGHGTADPAASQPQATVVSENVSVDQDAKEGAEVSDSIKPIEGKETEIEETSTDSGFQNISVNSWSKHVDELTGASYYFNEHTGESTWTPPDAFAGNVKSTVDA